MGERVRERFWSWMGGNLMRYGALPAGSARTARTEGGTGQRLTEYVARWAYYENKRLYSVLKDLGLYSMAMPTEWNPVPAIVAFYQANTLGRDMAIAAEQEARQKAVAAAVDQVWAWSNFGRLALELVETAAVLSDCFVKVAEKTAGPEEPTTAVYLQTLPPEHVRSLKTDERGFVVEIRIDTPRNESIFGTETRKHVLVEYWKKDWGEGEGGVRFYEVGATGDVEDERLGEPARVQTFAELGYDFIPVAYAETPAHWWGLTDQIDGYNRKAWQLNRLNRPTGVIHSRHVDTDGRPMPAPRVATAVEQEATTEESADGLAGWIRVPGNAQFEWASSPVDFGAMVAQMERTRGGVEDALPEYRVATLDATQVATETLQVLFGMAAERVLTVRETLEGALSRAQEMALTLGQLAGLAGFEEGEIGTWEDGGIRHGFVERAVFTPTAGMVAGAFQQFVAGGLPPKLALEAANADEGLVADYDAAAAEEALRARTTLAATLVRQQALVDSGAADNGVTRP